MARVVMLLAVTVALALPTVPARALTMPARAAPPAPASVSETHSPELLRLLSNPPNGSVVSPAIAAGPRGVDVAAFQHPGHAAIDWKKVAAAGYHFAAVKATEGNYYVNSYAASDLSAAADAGLAATVYHFAVPNVSGGAAQADYAVAHSRYAPDGRRLPLMLDIEYDPYVSSDHTNECYGLGHAAMVAWIRSFVTRAQQLTGQLPIIYTPPAWWQACTGGSGAFSADPLWVAAYAVSAPPLPHGWRVWTFWQYTSSGTVPGIKTSGDTDLSYFNDRSAVSLLDPGNQKTSAGARVSLPIRSLNGAAGQQMRYTATGLPHGLAASAPASAQGTIAGQVTARPGTYQVTVSARNPASVTGSVSFRWQVVG
jgi:GH25 family lysozyme M1 (1,4-beta-N-acetylmuramidase)